SELAAKIVQYMKLGKINPRLLDKFLCKHLLQIFTEKEDTERVLDVVILAKLANISLGEQTYVALLKYCQMRNLELGKKIHMQIKLAGLEQNTKVLLALINFYSKCLDNLKEIKALLRENEERPEVL